jgi:hypothetical protein
VNQLSTCCDRKSTVFSISAPQVGRNCTEGPRRWLARFCRRQARRSSAALQICRAILSSNPPRDGSGDDGARVPRGTADDAGRTRPHLRGKTQLEQRGRAQGSRERPDIPRATWSGAPAASRQRWSFPRRSDFNFQGECLASLLRSMRVGEANDHALPRFDTTCINLGIGTMGRKSGPNRPIGFTTR